MHKLIDNIIKIAVTYLYIGVLFALYFYNRIYAGVAQRQSSGIVNRRLRVQFSPPAP